VGFPGAGVELRGTMIVPTAAGACPGVVMIGGSGPSDRHNDGLFDALGEYLAGAGIAVLCYDKRGAGESTGTWATATVDELARDAAGAVATMRAQPEVAAGAVGVLGHSEGGWVALRLDAQRVSPAHVILNSCPAVSFLESEVFALTQEGVEEQTAASVYQQLATAVQAGRRYQDGQRVLAAYQRESWYDALHANGFYLDETTWAQLGAWSGYDPSDDLARMTTPTLAIFGEDDPLVPVRASAVRYEQTAAQAARPQRTVVFTGADHRLRTGAGFAPGYLALLATWCHEMSPCH
jgi:uncharacterized protein